MIGQRHPHQGSGAGRARQVPEEAGGDLESHIRQRRLMPCDSLLDGELRRAQQPGGGNGGSGVSSPAKSGSLLCGGGEQGRGFQTRRLPNGIRVPQSQQNRPTQDMG